ncbi:MAG: Fe-S cluster assembly protein HesB, partial [candidate division Zixibacteria bacterium]|nr:Fe-S cluster assembly protein HesB [candidate division Zixibacteria bacterium]
PYSSAVAEIMLQQTQVERVIPIYSSWLKRWPDWESLAQASPRQLLAAWSGLGYNRRAIYLGRLAHEVMETYGGRLPDDPRVLMTLPGIGRYTAHAILVFSANRLLAAIDTNIRRVILHEFNLPADLPNAELERIALKLLPRGKARDWHNALMDYGRLRLPRKIAAVPPASRQSTFVGSIRQIRGEIIRRLATHHRVSLTALARQLSRSLNDVRQAAQALEKDGLVRVGSVYITLTGTIPKRNRPR